jgi:hypothetical protein
MQTTERNPDPARRRLLSMTAACALLAVAGCETPVNVQNLPDITFAHLAPIAMNVASVQVENRFHPPLSLPHVEHRVPVAPAKALSQWAKDRIKPVGGVGTAKLIIEDASVTETKLARDESLKGTFTKQQSHRYDLAVRASLVMLDGAGVERGVSEARSSRSITVREDLSLNDWEKTLFETTDHLLTDFNTEMESNIRRHLADWIR